MVVEYIKSGVEEGRKDIKGGRGWRREYMWSSRVE